MVLMNTGLLDFSDTSVWHNLFQIGFLLLLRIEITILAEGDLPSASHKRLSQDRLISHNGASLRSGKIHKNM